jgi:sirohydrochlorin cobaltochelatase
MRDEKFNEIYIQPLHIIYGDEYEKIKSATLNFSNVFDKIEIGRPSLFNNKDYFDAIEALKYQLPKIEDNSSIVLMGHGTTHHENSAYFQLEYVARKMGLKIFIWQLLNLFLKSQTLLLI